MASYALIRNGKIVNVIEADEAFAAAMRMRFDEVVDVTNTPCGIGWSRTAGGFIDDRPQPPVEAAPPDTRVITKLAFLRRLTVDEEVDLELASLDVPTGQPAARRTAARVRVATRRLSTAQFIDLDDPEVVGTLQQFEAAGLLAAGRAAAILSAPVQPNERTGA
jgi:hypothetical protein